MTIQYPPDSRPFMVKGTLLHCRNGREFNIGIGLWLMLKLRLLSIEHVEAIFQPQLREKK